MRLGADVVVKVSTSELLLDSLIDLQNVQAALLVDPRGYIIEKRGQSVAIKDDDITEGNKKSGLSNLYILRAGADYLIVVFDEKLNFERLKSSVDATFAQFDLTT